MTMMMSKLPQDLVEEILSRIPFNSMRAVRLTCQNWNTLSTTRLFMGRAVTTKEHESCMIVLRDHNLHLMSVLVNENPSTKSLGQLTCLDEQVKISRVYHCDGLLLCILKDHNTKIVVWNPYLGQMRWIQTRGSMYNTYQYQYGIGYGYHNDNHKNISCRSYKILRFMNNGSHFFSYETYDFDSNVWTTYYLNPNRSVFFCERGVSLKGNMYWYVRKFSGQKDYTVCFDFTKKRFEAFQDMPFSALYNQLVTLSCVRDEKLSVMFVTTDTYVIDIWITNKIEEQKMSWNKFLRVDLLLLEYFGILGRDFLIDEEKKVAIFFDKDREGRLDTLKIFGEDGYFRELDTGESLDKTFLPLMCSYIPSLAQIKLPERGKRKRQSD